MVSILTNTNDGLVTAKKSAVVGNTIWRSLTGSQLPGDDTVVGRNILAAVLSVAASAKLAI